MPSFLASSAARSAGQSGPLRPRRARMKARAAFGSVEEGESLTEETGNRQSLLLTPASAKVAMPEWHNAAARTIGIAKAAPDASPSRMPKSSSGFLDRKSTRLNSSHLGISYAVFCLKKK